VTNQRQTVYA